MIGSKWPNYIRKSNAFFTHIKISFRMVQISQIFDISYISWQSSGFINKNWNLCIYEKVYLLNELIFFSKILPYSNVHWPPSFHEICSKIVLALDINFSTYTQEDGVNWDIVLDFYENWSIGTTTVVHSIFSNVIWPRLYDHKTLSKARLHSWKCLVYSSLVSV